MSEENINVIGPNLFEAQIAAIRSRFLSEVREKISHLRATRDEIDRYIEMLQEDENSMMGIVAGEPLPPMQTETAAPTSDPTAADKMLAAEAVYKFLAENRGQRFKASRLSPRVGEPLHGIPARELIALWNASHNGKTTIRREGERAATKYYVR